ncbi:unnamed protein product [Cuscuta epithymum]|nr:unnamed protein product [Cuscuta epithymum]
MSHCDATDKIALWRTHREGKKNNIARGLSNLTLGHAKSELT